VTNPSRWEYSCHSATHNSYSRIDYFLISKSMIPNVNDSLYKSIVISDHDLLLVNCTVKAAIKGPTIWRLSPRWLHANTFFKFNTNQTSASTRWEAFKAYIRGQMISYTSGMSNKQHLKLMELEKYIKKLETNQP